MTYNNSFIKDLISDGLYAYVSVFRSQKMKALVLGVMARFIAGISRRKPSSSIRGASTGMPEAIFTWRICVEYVGVGKMTSSPGSITAITAEASPSIAPTVTIICPAFALIRLS